MRAHFLATIGAVLATGCASAPRRDVPSSSPASVAAVRANPCADIAREEPLEEGGLLAVRAGDAIRDLDTATWDESWTREGAIVPDVVAGRSLRLVPLTWPGNGAALVFLREAPTEGACVLAVWAFGFGGNGIDLRAIAVEPVSATEVHIRVDLVGHYRGYYEEPDDASRYVPPAEEPMQRLVGTDGKRAWMIEEG